MDLKKKIELVYNINGFIPLMLRTWAVVFVVKYVNTNIPMDQLSIAKIAIGALSVLFLQICKNDKILDVLSLNLGAVYSIYAFINAGSELIIFIDPFTYLVVEAIRVGSLDMIISTAFEDSLNTIFIGRDKTNFRSTWNQTKFIAIGLGGLLGFVFDNINLNIAVIIIVISDLIIIPANIYLFKLIKEAQK